MKLESEPAPKDEHRTTIIIGAQSDKASRPLILNETLMRERVLAGCSCELADASLSGDFLKRFYERNNVKTAKLIFQGVPIKTLSRRGPGFSNQNIRVHDRRQERDPRSYLVRNQQR